MGQFSDICKIMEDLDRKYHMGNHEDDKEPKEDALIKHLEEEYRKNNNEKSSD